MAIQASACVAGAIVVRCAARSVRATAGPGLAAAAIGTTTAFMLMVAAPGNLVRLGSQFVAPSVFDVATSAYRFSVIFIRYSLLEAPLAYAIAVAVPVLIAINSTGRDRAGNPQASQGDVVSYRWLIYLPPITFAAIVLCFVPAAYAMRMFPAHRAVIVPQFVLMSAIMGWAYLAGAALSHAAKPSWLQSAAIPAALLVLISAYPIVAASRILADLPRQQRYASDWDDFDRQARAAAARHADIISLPAPRNIAGMETLTTRPSHWLNRCMSAYYGVRIVAQDDGR